MDSLYVDSFCYVHTLQRRDTTQALPENGGFQFLVKRDVGIIGPFFGQIIVQAGWNLQIETEDRTTF